MCDTPFGVIKKQFAIFFEVCDEKLSSHFQAFFVANNQCKV